jgi:hypothetical protein
MAGPLSYMGLGLGTKAVGGEGATRMIAGWLEPVGGTKHTIPPACVDEIEVNKKEVNQG